MVMLQRIYLHGPGPSKATDQRLRCRPVSQPAPAQSLVFAGVLTIDQYSNCWFYAASRLGQRLRHWRSTEAAGYKITPA